MGYDLVNIETPEGTYPINGKICDGAMTGAYLKVANNISKTDSTSAQSTASTYSLASYLPNDGYTYLVNFELIGTSTASTSGTIISGFVGSDLIGGLNTCSSVSRASSKAESTGNSWVPIGPNRQVSIYNGYGNAGTFTLCAYIYRRIGKNPTNPSLGTWTTPIRVGTSYWNGVAYGNGKFVAVGDGGYSTTSEDGLNWTEPSRPSNKNLYAITYGNGKFVIVGASGNIITSVNGETAASQVQVGTVNWESVCYGNGKFVAVGASGYTTTSTDGITWTTSVQVGSYSWNAVTYANGKFVAVGVSGYTTTSTDGTTWTTPVQVGSSSWQAVVYGNGYYAAAGDGGYFSRSPDGIAWTTPEQKGSNTWVGITFNNHDFIAVGTSGYISTSINGTAWTTPMRVSTAYWQGVTYGNGKFVAVGGDGYTTTSTPCVQTVLVPTADGITYENCNVALYRSCEYNESNSALSFYYGDYAEIPHGRYTNATYQVEFTIGSIIPVSGATTIQNIIHSERWITLELAYNTTNGTYIQAWNWSTLETISVVPNSAISTYSTYQIQYETYDTSARTRYRKSANTLAWSISAQVGSYGWRGVTYGNGKFVAVDFDGYTTSSTDGTTWTTPVRVDSSYWYGVTYANGKFVTVGDGGYISTSTDGSTWTTPVRIGSYGWRGVTYGNGKFVTVGDGGYISTSTSTDGSTWTTPVQVGSFNWYEVTYGNDKFVAVGASGYTTTSTDGITWTTPVQVSTSDYWYGVTYGNGKFVAVGASRYISTSTDGITWTTPIAVGTNWRGVTYGNGKFVAVGYGGYVSTSIDGITWTTPVQINSDDYWYGVTYGNGKFVAVGSSGYTVAATPDWGSWSSWTSWNDIGRGVNWEYPVRLGQATHKHYPIMDNRAFKGVIDLDGCYIAPTGNRYAWVPDMSSIIGDTNNVLANLLRYNWPCNTIYCSTASPSTSSDVYFANGSTYFTAGGDDFMAKVTSYNSSTKVAKVAFYKASFDTASIGSVDAYYNESKNASTTIPYWSGTSGKSSEIFDLVFSYNGIDSMWQHKEYGSITMTLSNGKATQPLSSYLPNDGCNYEILFDVTWVTGSAANNAANLNIYWTTDGVDYSVWMGRVKTYNAVAQEKSAIFVLGPLKSTSTLTYNVTGTTSGKAYASYHTYRKLGTRGNSIVTSVDNMSYRNGLGNVVTNPVGSWRLPGEWIITGMTVAGNLTINSSNSGKARTISLASYLPSDNFQYELIITGEVSSGTTNGNILTISLSSSIASGRLCRVKSTTAAAARSRQSARFVVDNNHTLSWTPTNSNSSATSSTWLNINAYRRVETSSAR